MNNITESLRKKINNFLNGGGAQNQLDRVFKEEMDDALEEVRPDITKICKTTIKEALTDLKSGGILFDKERLTRMLNDELENAMGDWDDEIKEVLANILLAEIKTSKILPHG